MLAEMINNAFIKDYKALIAQSHFAKFPIVFCCHMCLTETKIYKWNAIVQQTAASIDTHFKYFKKQDDYAMIDKDTSMLNITFLFYCIFKASNAIGFDK